MDELGFIKIRNFCASKDTILKVKRQTSGTEKIFANIYLIRNLYPEYKNNSYSSTVKRQHNLKVGKGSAQNFFQRRGTDVQVHEGMLNVISHQGNSNPKTTKYHFTPTGVAMIKKIELLLSN